MAHVLERGNIYFVYRPRVEHATAGGIEDVQRFFLVLSPHGGARYRLIVIGRKKLPEVETHRDRGWRFVGKVSDVPEDIEDDLDALTYPTKHAASGTSRQRGPPGKACTPYRRREDPEEPAPPGVGLPEREQATLPGYLRERFGGRRFSPVIQWVSCAAHGRVGEVGLMRPSGLPRDGMQRDVEDAAMLGATRFSIDITYEAGGQRRVPPRIQVVVPVALEVNLSGQWLVLWVRHDQVNMPRSGERPEQRYRPGTMLSNR